MRLTYYLRDNGACGYYRVSAPINHWRSRDKSLETIEISQGVSVDTLKKSFDAQVTMIPRVSEPKLLETIVGIRKENGMKFILDHDDDMFNISPLSPHYGDFGTENANYIDNYGNKIPIWEDGKNIDLKKNRDRMDGMKRSCEEADMITVTTEVLAETYRKFNDNVSVLPNCIDLTDWNKLPFKETKEVRICWFGGHSHYEDWFIISKAIQKVMNKYSYAKLVLMGHKWDSTLEGIRKDQIEYHHWVPTSAYPYKAAILNPTISIIPLRDTPFNSNKSAIKWIEMASLQVPSVASYLSPYKEMDNGFNGVFVAGNKTDDWISAISYLIDNPDKRIELGNNARKFVEENYDINNKWVLWKNAYEKLLEA